MLKMKPFPIVLVLAFLPLHLHGFDDFPDVVATDLDGLWAFSGDGDGEFGESFFLPVEDCAAECPEPWALATGDLNQNGMADVVSANRLANHVSLHFGKGDGTFLSRTILPTSPSPYDVDLGDLDQDGDLDLVIACNYDPGAVEVRFNDGSGDFGEPQALHPGNQPFNCELADFNGDGRLDLAVTNNASDSFTVYFNAGSGVLELEKEISCGNDPKPIKSGRFDDDDNLDLILANTASGQVRLFLGDGAGNFTQQRTYATGGQPRDLVVVDLNGDGAQDFAAAAGRGTDYISRFLNGGNGAFSGPVNFTTGPRPNSIDSADFNLDGKPDLVVANWSLDDPALATMSLLLGDGSGGFPEKSDFRPPDGFRKFTSLAVGHFNAYRFRRGDANLDGRLNINDPIRILRHLFSGSALPCLDSADVDDNSAVDLTDAIRLLEFLFLRGLPPAPPFTAPGTDPTADRLACRPD